MDLIKKLSIAAICIFSFSGNAHALEWYLGLDAFDWEFEDEDNASGEVVDGTSVRGRLGFVITKNLVIETQFAAPGSETNGTSTVDFQNMFNFMAQGVYPIGKANLYAVLGISSVRTSREFGGMTFSGRDSGFSYGLGANFRFSRHFAINGDYTQYLDKSNMKLGAFSLGLTYYMFSKHKN